jgi:hypothetical protein
VRVGVRRTATVAAVLMTATVLGGGAAHAAEPYECPDLEICLYDGPDGTGESFVVPIKWQGGYKLESTGWANRAVSVRSNQPVTFYLYSTPPGEDPGCRILRDTYVVGEQRNIAPEGTRNFDLVANQQWPEC